MSRTSRPNDPGLECDYCGMPVGETYWWIGSATILCSECFEVLVWLGLDG